MSVIGPTLQAFFTNRLARQRQVSPRTIASYRDTLKLLLHFAHQTIGKVPSALDWDDLDEPLISAFLTHLETQRRNSVRTRNLRLTAIRSLFRYAAYQHPEHGAVIHRVLAIPAKRFDKRLISFLTAEESQALIEAPDQARWEGRRDRALLMLALQTGLRVSEIINLNCADIIFGDGAHVRCEGKGRKQRAVPLTNPTQTLLHVWLAERAGLPGDPLFPTRTGRRLSRDAIERRVATHAAIAAGRCPSLHGKKVHAHVLRHSNAMALLHAGVDTAVIALWLGHADIPLHRALPARRPRHQGTRTRDDLPSNGRARPLPPTRHVAGLPRRPITMPTAARQTAARSPPPPHNPAQPGQMSA